MNATMVSPRIVEEAMGWESGRVPPIGWLLIQEMQAGLTLGDVATGLGVEKDALVALIESVTQLAGEEALAAWGNAIVALKAAVAANANQVTYGWDSIEAMAVEKLGKSLESMATNGDPLKMLSIATQANKAIRRHKGEGQSGKTTIGFMAQMGQGGEMKVGMELQSGHLGTMRLNLSPRIQAQLGDPERVIDGVANQTVKPKLALTMLGLKETRKLADELNVKTAGELEATHEIDLSMFDGVNFG